MRKPSARRPRRSGDIVNTSHRRRGLLAAVALAAATTLSGVVTGAPAGATAPTSDVTSAQEAARVDSVPTPKLNWYKCYSVFECDTVRLPMDYDQPDGPTVEVAVLRAKAKDPAHRIGTLFVNPGGPGGSGTQFATVAQAILGRDVVNRFDIVGFDPRGTNFSDNVHCFGSVREQAAALAGFAVAFPVTFKEQHAWIGSSRSLGTGCSGTGQPLASSMSTAEVARDMDVLRRAVGDTKLTYLGFSYGTYLGQVYANMFPDRVRAVAIDGVMDPIAWTGTDATADQPQTDRLHSADGAWTALKELFRRCKAAGPSRCAEGGRNPQADFALVARRLKAKPIVQTDPVYGEFRFTYADFVATTLGALYSPLGGEEIMSNVSDLLMVTSGTVPAPKQAASMHALVRRVTARTQRADAREKSRPGWDFPYDSSLEAFTSVLCTDGRNPADAASWSRSALAADRRAPYFGSAWIWASSPCASRTWTEPDQNAWDGPFDERTSAPVLVVGSYWDPATNYLGAYHVSRLLPNSRLLRSNSWGHTSYNTSACVTNAVNAYLVGQALPPVGRVCLGDDQPFTKSSDGGFFSSTTTLKGVVVTRTAQTHRILPPVAPLVPQRVPVG